MDLVLGIWDNGILLGDVDDVVTDTIARGHREVGDGSSHDDEGGDDVIETLGLKVGISG